MFEHVFCLLRSHGTRDKAGSIIDKGYRERWLAEVLWENCSRETVSGEMLAGNVRLASLARHTIVAGATIKPVPGHGTGDVW